MCFVAHVVCHVFHLEFNCVEIFVMHVAAQLNFWSLSLGQTSSLNMCLQSSLSLCFGQTICFVAHVVCRVMLESLCQHAHIKSWSLGPGKLASAQRLVAVCKSVSCISCVSCI